MIGQLQSTPAREWISALEREGFRTRKSKGSHHIYQHSDGRRVLIVYHKLSDTFGPKTVKQLLEGTGWNERDLRNLKLLK
ncbi:MAG: type II toxin-antitoxin system HicA family toxin [Acidobacteria bacterium]|nr:type II toxin-antitoxin system HicA family toxin [Acidobacteriota bacterium]